MNWKSIEKNNKKAFSKLISDWNIKTYKCTEFELLCNSASQNHSANIIVNDRDLYDFFDDNGVYVTVDREYDMVAEEHTIDWSYYISQCNKKRGISNDDYFSSRIIAETNAFLCAFNVLEEKL